ncbi:glycosyltransferase family 4 protein [Desulforamulus ruminis]|uniref:glycosyltransferase family 4 protein n=1 Tax=Desulforamulus ruminis TaxID=1564 RepID=UPI0023562763|nr:glycosyltransferase family 1 protein [Desulforamulus ruminis]
MKVAIFTDTFVPHVNGVARTIGRLADHLAARGIPCLVLSPDVNLSVPNGYQIYPSPGFEVPFYQECKVALPNFSEISSQLDFFQPTIIHLVTEISMGLCGLKYAAARQIPAVGSYHTNFPQYLSYYKLGLFTNWVWKYLKWFHNQCLVNYCPSRSTLQLLEKKGIRNLQLWGRGIDASLYQPGKADPSFKARIGAQNKTLLLYVGRLAPEKDLDILMETMKVIHPIHPDIHLVITGDGPLAAKLKEEATPNITFTGYLHGEELATVYASCDIFVFPSTTETYGNVILEAMASGLPVVAPYCGGIKDNLLDRHNGLVCRPRSVRDMMKILVALKENPALRKTLACQARAYSLSKSWDQELNNLLDSYDNVVHRRQGVAL